MPKVSIIIAAYNIERYIEKCLISCINQSFKDIEIIVVNDGSTDKTIEIIKNYKNKDCRIKIIDKKNSGLIDARKSGFEVANGEYILFVDGDDWLDTNAINILYNSAKEKDYDIVCYKYLLKYEDGSKKKGWDTNNKISNDSNLLELLFDKKINHNICFKFIKKSFILKHKIEFPNGISYGEDLAFIYTLAMHNPSFILINKFLYYYYQRKGSLDNNINEKVCEITKAIKFIKNQLKANNLYEKYREEFEFMAYNQAYYMRKDYIFTNKDEISKKLFNNWRKLKIKINVKNNQFYKALYKNDSKKALIVDSICKKNYLLGHIYYNMKL